MLNFTYGTLGAGASTSIVSAPQHYYSSIGETIDSPLSSSWINGRDPRLRLYPKQYPNAIGFMDGASIIMALKRATLLFHQQSIS